jgi:hypothetical protein
MRRTAPPTANTPSPMSPPVANIPAAPMDCSTAKVEPAATLPMPDCTPAAMDPATMPDDENPAAVRAPPVAATAPPVAAKPLPILVTTPLFCYWPLGSDIFYRVNHI